MCVYMYIYIYISVYIYIYIYIYIFVTYKVPGLLDPGILRRVDSHCADWPAATFYNIIIISIFIILTIISIVIIIMIIISTIRTLPSEAPLVRRHI